jgi:hypothetical protein
MFKLEGRVAKADLREQKELDGVISGLEAEGFAPLLRSMARTAGQIAGLADQTLPLASLVMNSRRFRPGPETGLIGDVFFRAGRAYALQPLNHQLYAWEICHHSDDCSVDEFHNCAEKVARHCLDGRRLRGMQFGWDPVPLAAPARVGGRLVPVASGPALAVQPVDYSESDAKSARVLLDRARREYLVRLAQMRGRVRAVDAKAEPNSAEIDALGAAGLIREEYLVQCRGDNRTILTAPTPESLAASDLRCPVCSRKTPEQCSVLRKSPRMPSPSLRTVLESKRFRLRRSKVRGRFPFDCARS